MIKIEKKKIKSALDIVSDIIGGKKVIEIGNLFSLEISAADNVSFEIEKTSAGTILKFTRNKPKILVDGPLVIDFPGQIDKIVYNNDKVLIDIRGLPDITLEVE